MSANSMVVGTEGHEGTWLVLARFEAPHDLDEQAVLDAIHAAIESTGGVFADETLGMINDGRVSDLNLYTAYDAAAEAAGEVQG